MRYYLLRTHLDRIVSRLALVTPAPLSLVIIERKPGLSFLECRLEFAFFLLHARRSLLNYLRFLLRSVIRVLCLRFRHTNIQVNRQSSLDAWSQVKRRRRYRVQHRLLL